jgi:hypothetical protein
MIATLLLHIRKILRYIYSVSRYYKNTKVMFFKRNLPSLILFLNSMLNYEPNLYRSASADCLLNNLLSRICLLRFFKHYELKISKTNFFQMAPRIYYCTGRKLF